MRRTMARSGRIHLLSVAGLLVAVMGCGERNPPADDGALAGTSWVLVYLGTDAALTDTEVTLAFVDDSSFAGGSGCNRYFGRYRSDPAAGSVNLGETGTTMMMCPPPHMEQEGRYLGALGRVSGYRLHDGRLELVEDSMPALTFVLTDEISTPN